MPASLAPPPLTRGCALYLDFDGTLAHIAPTPAAVVTPPQVPELLQQLCARLGGAVAVVTGRRLADVDALLAPARMPGAGLHGTELRLAPGEAPHFEPLPEIARVVAGLRQRFAGEPGVLVEDKGGAVALHFRLAPERAADCRAALRELTAGSGLEIIVGKMVVEARLRGADKGRALQALAAHPPFSGRTPVFVGDDVTDEDGFAAASALGGHGVKVGDSSSSARYRCRDVDEVHDWLRASLLRMEQA